MRFRLFKGILRSGYQAWSLCLITAILCISSQAQKTASCTATELDVAPSSTDAGMGKAEITFSVSNVGSRSCTLTGIPKIDVIGKSNRRLQLTKRPARQE